MIFTGIYHSTVYIKLLIQPSPSWFTGSDHWLSALFEHHKIEDAFSITVIKLAASVFGLTTFLNKYFFFCLIITYLMDAVGLRYGGPEKGFVTNSVIKGFSASGRRGTIVICNVWHL